jgi:hypothetical protein
VFEQVGRAEQRLAHVRKVRSITGIVAAVCSVALVVGVLAGTGSLTGTKVSPAGTSLPVSTPVALITPASGAHVLLVQVGANLGVMSPTTGKVLKTITLHLPSSFTAPGVVVARFAGFFAAVPGDATAFARYGVQVRGGLLSDYVVAIDLRDGHESIFAPGGDPALSPNGTYLAWQGEVKNPAGRLSSTVYVENLKTGHRHQLSAIPGPSSSATVVSESASMRLAWSPNSSDLAISYEGEVPSPGQEHISVLQVGQPLSSGNPRPILPVRNIVGNDISAMAWLNSDQLLVGGNDACAIPKDSVICTTPSFTRKFFVGPVYATVNVTSGTVEPDANGNLVSVQGLATDPTTGITVVVGSPPTASGNFVLERFGHPVILASTSWAAWISEGPA